MLLAIPLAYLIATGSATSSSVEEWFQSNKPLDSQTLIELVPLAHNPGYGTDRFSIEHLWRLHSNKTDQELAPQFDFDTFVQSHGSSPENCYKYGEMLFYGVGGTRNLTKAGEYYELAAKTGHSEAQFMMGVAYSSGFFGNWPQNQALATLYYSFAAMNESARASMAMGYRYRRGIDSPVSLPESYDYYITAANQCLDYFEDFPYVGNRYLPFDSYNVADQNDGGIYGKMNPRSRLRRSRLRELLHQFDSIQEGLDYLEFNAFEDGATAALQYLAQAYQMDIENGLPNFDIAADKAEELLKRTHKDATRDGRKLESWALSCLADCTRRGQGRPFDLEKARELYLEALHVAPRPEKNEENQQLGSDIKDCPHCYSGLGQIALYEIEQLENNAENKPQIDKLYAEARSYFQKGSLLSSPMSQYYLGREFYEQGYVDKAQMLLSKCDDIVPQAAYTLGLIYFEQFTITGAEKWLKKGADAMASVCMQVEEFYSPARYAHYAYPKDQDAALVAFLVAAELGLTTAQVNVADILDVQHSSLHFDWLYKWPVPTYVDPAIRAATSLLYFGRAAQSYSLDSLYKVGDYLYHGLGTQKDIQGAVQIYETLYRRFGYPMAYWAMGWLYDHGVGVSQDFRKAIEFYTTSLVFAKARGSYLAIKFSILGLYVRWFIAKLYGADTQLDSAEDPNESIAKKSWLQSIKDARQIIKRTSGDSDDEVLEQTLQEALGGGDGADDEYTEGTLMVDIAIVALVFVMLGTLVWARRRRGVVDL